MNHQKVAMLLSSFMMASCSASANGTGLADPELDRPSPDAAGLDPGGPPQSEGDVRYDDSTDFKVSSNCVVSDYWVVFEIIIPTVHYKADGTAVQREDILWNIECGDFPACNGTYTMLRRIRRGDPHLPQGMSEAVVGAQVVSVRGLVATIRVGEAEFVIDAKEGLVTFRGGFYGHLASRGQARCDSHGPPIGPKIQT
ncbi:MAG: hypothetical protein AAGC55_21995 [Myxococcota bacterium]